MLSKWSKTNPDLPPTEELVNLIVAPSHIKGEEGRVTQKQIKTWSGKCIVKLYEKHEYHVVAKGFISPSKYKEFEYAVVDPARIKSWPKNKNINDYYVIDQAVV